MSRILVAASPEPRGIATRILAGHELTCAESLEHAEQLLREQSFDLIFCTVAFDESRMFELLKLAKSRPEWQCIPFVGARVRAHVLRSPAALHAAELTCQELGAAAFLDIANYEAEPEREMRNAIEEFIEPASRH